MSIIARILIMKTLQLMIQETRWLKRDFRLFVENAEASIKVSNRLPFVSVGDRIEISYNRETTVTDIVSIK